MKFEFSSGVSFHRDLNLFVLQPRGVVDEAHVEELVSMLEQAEDDAKHPFNRYTDCSAAHTVELSFEYVFRVALYRRVVYGERPPVKSAVYVVDRVTAQHALPTPSLPPVRLCK